MGNVADTQSISRSWELEGRLISRYHLVASESPMHLHTKHVISGLLDTSGALLVHRHSRWIVLLRCGFSHSQTTLVNLPHCSLPSVSRDVHSCRPVAAAATGKTKLRPNQEASKRWGCYWIDHACHCMLSEAGGTDGTSDQLICRRMQKRWVRGHILRSRATGLPLHQPPRSRLLHQTWGRRNMRRVLSYRHYLI